MLGVVNVIPLVIRAEFADIINLPQNTDLAIDHRMLSPSVLTQMGKVTSLQTIIKRGITVARLPTHQLEVSKGR